ncbi:MAG: hypothetical protein H6Q55_646 [Deltaproteobacteria bacterium]|nr:hypothetical protein [Deltaproteobacteria bacterium]
MKRCTLVSFFLLSLVLASGSQAANLVQNPSFELGFPATSAEPSFPYYLTRFAGSSDIPDWTVQSGSVDWVNWVANDNREWVAAEGTKSIDLNGTSTGSLSQMLNTVAGTSYVVSFFMAGNPLGDRFKDLQLSIGGLTETFTFDSLGKTASNMGWSPRFFSQAFVATGTSTTLTFTSLEADPFHGPAIDNVMVESVTTPTPVPEPSLLALLACGLVGVMTTRRRLST